MTDKKKENVDPKDGIVNVRDVRRGPTAEGKGQIIDANTARQTTIQVQRQAAAGNVRMRKGAAHIDPGDPAERLAAPERTKHRQGTPTLVHDGRSTVGVPHVVQMRGAVVREHAGEPPAPVVATRTIGPNAEIAEAAPEAKPAKKKGAKKK